jgi:hypothetical protein
MIYVLQFRLAKATFKKNFRTQTAVVGNLIAIDSIKFGLNPAHTNTAPD